jgi:hypothetical protein
MRLSILLVLAACVAGLPGARADEAASSPADQRVERIRALRQQRPADGVLAYYEAAALVGAGRKQEAVDTLRGLLGRGLGLVPVRDLGFDSVWNDPPFQRVRQQLADEEARTPDSPLAFRLSDPKLIPEGIAYDAAGRRFFLGSVAQHKLVVVDAKGRGQRDVSRPADGLDAVLGVTVDAPRDRVCAVSTNAFENSVAQQRRNHIVCYGLKTLHPVARLEAPDAKQLNDLVIAPDGTVYASDSEGHSVFRCAPKATTCSLLGDAGGIRGANGITLSPQGVLFVSLTTGVARVGPATGDATRLPQPDNVVTGGIDGLYWHQGALIGVQNVTNPGRVIRIALAEDGKRIEGVTVLQSSHHAALDEPTTGAIANDALYLIANSQVGRYQPDGTLKDESSLKGTAVLAVPLRR